MSKKVMIIGGTGNISVSIVNLLLEQGSRVYCFNRGQRGETLPDEVTQIHGDRNDREAFEKTMQQYSFDAVIDMIGFTKEDALSTIRAFPDVGHMIFCSTVCVVGIEPEYLPMDETHILRPITDYGRGKGAAEAVFLTEYYSRKYPVTIIRPSTTYGRQPSMVRQLSWDSSWIDRNRKGKPIVICGEGMELHQFLHVDDAATGFVGAIGRECCLGEIYSLVRDDCFTWKQFHETAMKVIGKDVELVSAPFEILQRFDIPGFELYKEIFLHHCYYSNAKISRDIPLFKPVISLEEGLEKTFAYMDSIGSIPNSDESRWEDDIVSLMKGI